MAAENKATTRPMRSRGPEGIAAIRRGCKWGGTNEHDRINAKSDTGGVGLALT